MADPIISLRGLTRQFQTGGDTVTVLRDVDLDIHQGELVAIISQPLLFGHDRFQLVSNPRWRLFPA